MCDKGYEIYEYSRRGKLAELREAFDGGCKADEYMGYDGSTALVVASRQGFAHIANELLLGGANPLLHTDDGSTMLHHAVSGGSPEVVTLILKAGVAINMPNEDGVTPLHLAAHYGLPGVVRVLINGGADINHEADGWGTPLDSAEPGEDAAKVLEANGAKRSEAGKGQAMAAAAERFTYGCFESGADITSGLKSVQSIAGAAVAKFKVGDLVTLRKAKSGMLKEGDVGEIIADDGSDCLPLKVKFGDACDYYEYTDVVIHIELPPDSDRATPEGTLRHTTSKLDARIPPSTLGDTGLRFSPVGFGCHRIDDDEEHKIALKLALKLGCNLVDLAPNYTNGKAERIVGEVLTELINSNQARRDELVIATKVGNVLGQQMQYAEGVPNMVVINDNLSHCIHPTWIEQEITRSLEHLQLKCVDCLLLHCPEVEVKDPSVSKEQVYERLKMAFTHLESEVSRGRIQVYGVSAAFFPLRPTDPEHLQLDTVMAQLPEGHHFRVLQFPLNFAEAQMKWVGHVPRNPDTTAVEKASVGDAPTFFETAKRHGLATWINRPLDGIYKESHGVLRFSSLDCDVRSFSELQLDNCDSLEEKITSICKLTEDPYRCQEGCGQLAAKTVKVLSSLEDVDCVLLGMRRPGYVMNTLPLAFGTPKVDKEVAAKAFKSAHNTIDMWFATAIHEADHGTSKDWRLPVEQKGICGEQKGICGYAA